MGKRMNDEEKIVIMRQYIEDFEDQYGDIDEYFKNFAEATDSVFARDAVDFEKTLNVIRRLLCA